MGTISRIVTSGRATLLDVAARAGVSRSTASRALSGSEAISPEARAKVEQAAADLGYRVNPAARTLRTRRTMLVGLVLNNLVNATFHVVAEVIQGRLDEKGYRVQLCITGADPDRERRYLEMMADHHVDGLVIIGTGQNQELIRGIARGGAAVVNLIRSASRPTGDSVLAADEDGARLATAHLLDLGHRRIGYIGGTQDSNSGRERYAGYSDELRRQGVPEEPELVLRGPFREEFGEQAIRNLLELQPAPTAVYVANHEAAFGVLPVLQDSGLSLPEDLSLVCHEDVRWFRHLHPAVTVVDNGAVELGHLAADRLLLGIEEGGSRAETGRTFRVGAQLVVRGSTHQAREVFTRKA